MASAPSEPRSVLGRVDRNGRLVSADPELEALQVEAGSRVGNQLALPQVAAVARLARSLGIAVSRRAVAADGNRDIELWVRAAPDGEEVALVLDGWISRPAGGPRLSNMLAQEAAVEPQAAPLLEWSTDDELKLTSLGPELAGLLAVQPADAVGQPLTRLFRLEDNQNGEMPLITAVAARQGFSDQPARGRSSESAAPILLSAEPLLAPDGSFLGFAGRAVLLGHPEVAEEAITTESFDAALDAALRTPLDRIIECAECIAEGGEGPLRSDYAAYASDISTAARHLLSVIGSMGDLHAQDQDAIDLAALAAEAAVMVESTAEQRRVSIALESARSLPARGEERGVIQVLVNLIGNAVRHSPEGGTVTLRFRRSADESSVTVIDEGPGIDPLDQQRIFERFERGSADAGGSGLGLAISRRLARSMGGDVELESAQGAGARFTLRLPAA